MKGSEKVNEIKTSWYYDQKFSRIRTGNKGSRITRYDETKTLGSGSFGIVKNLKPQENRKLKAVKYSNASLKGEYEISLKWPKKAIGLLIQSKAYFPSTKSGMPDAIVMHKYDGKLTEFYYDMNSEQKLEAICQISQGVATLHDLRILHLDLFFDNILYDKRMNRYDLADFGVAVVNDKNFEVGCINETKNLIQLIDKILFESSNKTWISLEVKNELAKLFGEKEITISEQESVRLKSLQQQGYSSGLAQQLLDFFARSLTDAKEVHAFFNNIQSEFSNLIKTFK